MFNRLLIFLTALMLAAAGLLAQASPASAASSAIDGRYATDPELRLLLGSPISSESTIYDGRLRHYQNGTLYWSPSTGVHEVHGSIRDRYRSYGGVQTLGFPTTDEWSVWVRFEFNEIGRASSFETGTIAWSEETGNRVMSKAIADEWAGCVADLLMPVADEEAVPGGHRVRFTSGGAIYSGVNGTHSLYDTLHGHDIRIDEKWGATGGSWGFLGIPASDLGVLDFNDDGINEGMTQNFANGRIYWQGDVEVGSAGPTAYEVHGPILARYLTEGGPKALGFPVSDQQAFDSGQRSRFEHADILLHPSGQTIVVPT